MTDIQRFNYSLFYYMYSSKTKDHVFITIFSSLVEKSCLKVNTTTETKVLSDVIFNRKFIRCMEIKDSLKVG